MDDLDTRVLKTCARLLKEGEPALLITVARTWGSSPRPPGALMVIGPNGLTVGSVSGGCIEDDMVARMREVGLAGLCPDGRPQVLRYGIDAASAARFGLPCGGTIELVMEPLGPHSGIDDLLASLQRREIVQRKLDLHSGHVHLKRTVPHADAPPSLSTQTLTTVLGPRHRLLVIGANDMSQYLCATALGLGFDITVCDPRIEQRQAWMLRGVSLVSEMPDDVVQAIRPDERTAVVALTHDPKLDDLALMDALKTRAFYVGAIGSRVNNQRRRERLLQHFGLSEAEVSRLRGPAGLFIGSKTPAEIALSILAEIVAAKNGVALPESVRIEAAKNAHPNTDHSLNSACTLPR